jgi:hypothetical protein
MTGKEPAACTREEIMEEVEALFPENSLNVKVEC